MVRSDRQRSASIIALSVALTACAVALLLGPLSGTEAVVPGLPWLVLVPAFTAAELVVVHVQARRESLSVSFAEIPLIVGLVFVSPAELVAASVLGSLLGLLHRRQSGLKLVFNLSMFALEGALAAAVFTLVLGTAEPASLRGIVAALVTIVATDLVSAAALTLVIWLKAGAYDEGVLSEAVTSGLVAALANTSVGLLVVVLVQTEPVALGLLLIVVVTLALAYRGYAGLSRGHARLESLYRFTRRVQRQDGTDAIVEAILRQSRDVLTAEVAELYLLSAPGLAVELRLVGDDVVRTRLPVAVEDLWWVRAAHGRSTVRARGHASPAPTPPGATAAAEPVDGSAMAAPLEVDGSVVAVLAVADRPHHLGSFTDDDLRLFESLANHAAVALHKAQLADRLREEADSQEYLSLHDSLTGLPNRRHALRTLSDALAAGASDPPGPAPSSGATVPPPRTAVVVLDIDGFSEINDAFGYDTGDHVLRGTGRLLARAHEPDHVARLGNDEFVVIIEGVADLDDAVRRTHQMLDGVNGPTTIDGVEVDVRCCAGVSLAPDHGADAALLIRRADAALYASKRDRSAVRTWDHTLAGDSNRRLALVSDLRQTLTAHELDVHFQPQVDPATGRPVGAEALARWHHPHLGDVPPDEFIRLAEHTNLIHPLTEQVLARALASCAHWRALVPDFTVAVNISARSLSNPALLSTVATALEHVGLPPQALVLEITETAVMSDVAHAVDVLHQLARTGVQLSIDDFGTGQSSLAYLRQLPVHEVKIDRSFFSPTGAAPGDHAIARAAVELGRTLGLRVVAEGVEDETTLALLADWGCSTTQGFHISRPLSAAEMARWLTRTLSSRERAQSAAL